MFIRRLMVVTAALCAIGLPCAASAQAAPANDDFADAVALSGVSVSQAGTNTAAGVQASEPTTGGSVRPQSVWYRWTAPYSTYVRIDTCTATAGDTFLGVFTGASLAGLTEAASADEGCSGSTGPSRVSFFATQGVAYSINVATPNGAGAGDFTLSLEIAPVPLIGPELSGTAFVGQPLSLTDGTWTGLQPITFTYSWYRFNVDGTYNSIIELDGSSTYTPTAADVGKRINGNVNASNAVSRVTVGGPLTAIVDYDTDHDGIGNTADDDDDGDELTDAAEAAIGTDPLLPDTDGDGMIDKVDPCPLSALYNNSTCGPPPQPSTLFGAETVRIAMPRATLTPTKAGIVKLKGGAVSTLSGSGGGASTAAYAATGRMVAQVAPKQGKRKKRVTISTSAFTLGPGESKPIEFQLTRSGMVLLRKVRKLNVTMAITVVAPDGSSLKAEQRYVLRAGVPVR